MKSPTELARRWARQWEVADTREQRLLDARSWPVSLPIGKPSAAEFTQRTGDVREHLKRWRAVPIGRVLWERVNFRGGGEPVEVPVHWVLDSPSEWAGACGEPGVREEFERLARLVPPRIRYFTERSSVNVTCFRTGLKRSSSKLSSLLVC